MITPERIYTEGYLDGMRYCGFLLSDVPDEDLHLTPTLIVSINKAYKARAFHTKGEDSVTKLHSFITQLVKDTNELYEENQILKRRLLYSRKVILPEVDTD